MAYAHFSWAIYLLFLFQKFEQASVAFMDLEVICFAGHLQING